MIDINALPFAIGIAISPIPIIAVILMLFSTHAKSNGTAFIVAWFLTIGAVSLGVIFTIVAGQDALSASDAESSSHWLRFVLSLVMFVLAFKNLRMYRKGAEAQKAPQWMVSINSFRPMKSALFAVLLCGVNPKNLSLIISGAIVIAEIGEINSMTFINLCVFTAIASFTIIIPVAYYIIAGKQAEKVLTMWKEWLSRKNAIVMFWILLILGVMLLVKGINGMM